MIIQIQPWINELELEELTKVIQSTFITENSMTKEFELMTLNLTGAKYAISVANGTLGLYCALLALGVGPGDEVLVPDMTFIATANAVIMAGAKPVLCDIESNCLGININNLASKITKKTKAIIPVHLYGNTTQMDDLLNFAKLYNLRVIEDAAQGVGVHFKGKHVGTFGDIGVLSYYGNKTITTGEGGVILTNDENLAKICYRLKNHGRDQKGSFKHDYIGFNFSFTDLQAAVGVAQMKKLPEILRRKKEIFDKYYSQLSTISELCFYKINNQEKPVYWFTSLYCKKRDNLAEFLQKEGIQTRRFFYPLHLQPCYQNSDKINKSGNFETSKEVYETGISLPSSYILTNIEQDYVIQKIKEFFN
jgi:perosamine synthetase